MKTLKLWLVLTLIAFNLSAHAGVWSCIAKTKRDDKALGRLFLNSELFNRKLGVLYVDQKIFCYHADITECVIEGHELSVNESTGSGVLRTSSGTLIQLRCEQGVQPQGGSGGSN